MEIAWIGYDDGIPYAIRRFLDISDFIYPPRRFRSRVMNRQPFDRPFPPASQQPRNHRFFETSSSNFRKREDGLSTMDFSQFSKTRGWPVDDERFADSSCFAVSRGSRDRKSERVDLSRSIFLANAGLHIN